ncbi:MAG: alkanesulfonate transporter substrate-binding subunit [Noviherbaspirillum sp.]|jgi:NitT/TauT family transport system substrate-binding protein|nr:alkanesulfonate transporter substrate-binding subunit [Noviherbaspirillum sp.]
MKSLQNWFKSSARIVGLSLCLSTTALSTGALHAADKITLAAVGKGSSLEWPVYIGISKGFFAEKGIEIDMVSAPSSASVFQWVASNSVMMGVGGLADPLRAIEKGAKIALLRTEAQVAPYGMMAKPGIKTMADLAGKKVSIGGAKDITRIYVDRMAAAQKAKSSQFDFMYAGATAARFAALQSGAVDAAILTPPFSFRAESANFTHLGLTADYVKDFPFTGFAVNAEWGRKNKPALQNFLAGMAKSIDWFYTDANKKEAVDILSKVSDTERRDIEQTYDLFRKINVFDRTGALDNQSVGNLVKALKDLGDIEGSTDAARFMDAELSRLAAQVK